MVVAENEAKGIWYKAVNLNNTKLMTRRNNSRFKMKPIFFGQIGSKNVSNRPRNLTSKFKRGSKQE